MTDEDLEEAEHLFYSGQVRDAADLQRRCVGSYELGNITFTLESNT